jgi:pimeloyl-ACP methyl ester carboxylesterase
MRSLILRSIAVLLGAGLLLTLIAFLVDMRRAYARIGEGSSVVATPEGAVEYARGGDGLPVLVLHGAGGGFDNGMLLARTVLGEGFHWIAPSRFGYLRSTFHEGATFDDQAHAYAHLLDSLGVATVAVVALSHGGPSALLFAALYPERVSSLTLLSAGVAASTDTAQEAANSKGNALARVFQWNALYWGASTFFRGQFLRLMGADDAVIASLTPEQRELANEVIEWMNPVAPRGAGATFDNTTRMPNARIAAITAPTLILHAVDDGLQLYHNAEFAAAHIPGATLRRFERGGHLLLAVEQAAVREATTSFIRTHAVE